GFAFPAPLPVGAATLSLRYRGHLIAHEGAGLFREREGDDWYIYSDFEPIDARRAFPCFDEPAYKVPWRLTLHVPREHLAVANAPIQSETPEANGLKRVVFKETAPLPTYLVALAVGPFGTVDAGRVGKKQIPVRIITLHGHERE